MHNIFIWRNRTFISAMNMMSSNLQKVAGSGMRRLLAKITNNRFAGVGIGAIVTMIIQSSAATTLMVIGFVNAETMNLHQATAIIMGANIGTTITGILASLQSLNPVISAMRRRAVIAEGHAESISSITVMR